MTENFPKTGDKEERTVDNNEKKTKNSINFKEHNLKLRKVMEELSGLLKETVQEQPETVNMAYDAIPELMYTYGRTAYHLGYSDGILTGTEDGKAGNRTVFKLEDMCNLVIIYDAVKQLNITILGSVEARNREEGILGALDRVYDVIASGAGTGIKLSGDEEETSFIVQVLDDVAKTPEERAKLLLGRTI